MIVNKNLKKPGDRKYPVNKYLSRTALLLTIVLLSYLLLFTGVQPVRADDSTFYSDSGSDAYTLDNNGAGAGDTWPVIIAQPGDTITDGESDSVSVYVRADSGAGDWRFTARGHYAFNTAPLPDGATVTGATFSLYGYNKANTFTLHTFEANIYEGDPADPTSMTADDHDAVSDTALSDSGFTFAGWNVAGYNTWTLNAAGLAAINKTGYTTISTRVEADADAEVPAWEASKTFLLYSYHEEKGSNMPRLYVEYTLPGVPQPPTNFQVVRTGVSSANLSWTSGNGTDGSEIWVSMDGFPWQSGTGYELYSGANTTYEADGLPEFITYYFTAWGTASGNVSANVTDAELTGVDMDVNLAVDGSLIVLAVACFLLLISIFLKKMLIYIALFMAWLMVIVTVDNMYLDGIAGVVMIFAVVQFLKARKGVEV